MYKSEKIETSLNSMWQKKGKTSKMTKEKLLKIGSEMDRSREGNLNIKSFD